MIKCLKIIIFVIFFQAGTAYGDAARCLKIATSSGSLGINKPELDADVQDVFFRANICAKIVQMSVGRISEEVKAGILDGVYFRGVGYVEAMKPDLVYPSTPVFQIPGFIVALKKNRKKLADLANVKNMKIGYMKNFVWTEALSSSIKQRKQATRVVDLVNMLKRGEVEGIISNQVSLALLVKNSLINPNEISISFPIGHIAAYVVLHRKNSDLLDKVDAAIRAVKSEGGFRVQSVK